MASDMTAEERGLLPAAEAVGVVAPPPAPAWVKSWRSGMANGCVEMAPAGVCNCGNDPNCQYCRGTGTVWI